MNTIFDIISTDDDELLALYNEAKVAYYNGDPIMTDEQFDALEALVAIDHPDVTSTNVGAPERGKKVKLPVQMGSLDQLHNQDELTRWEQKWPTGTTRVITEKLDGNSGLVEYADGKLVASYSRGDGYEGANNLRHISKMSCVPKDVNGITVDPLYVRGETIVSKSNWVNYVQPLAVNRAGKQYANSRNFIAGFLNGKTGNEKLYQYIDFVAYEIVGSQLSKQEQLMLLTQLGFKIPKSTVYTTGSYVGLEDITRSFIEMSEYELDGVVIDVDLGNYRFADGELNPSYARKLKLINDANVAETTVTAVEWNISKDLMLKPLVHFEPIVLDGAVITKATGHNARNIVDLGIGVGATIKVIRSGMVIPKIIECTDPRPVELPKGTWNATNVELVSDGIGAGREICIKRLDHFFTTLGVEYIGVGNIAKMVDAGVLSTPTSAIKCSDATYERVIGENGRKCAESLRKKLQNVEPETILASFGVLGRGIGARKIRALIAGVGLEAVLNATVTEQQIACVDGFDVKTAAKITKSIGELIKLYDEVSPYIKLATAEPVGDGFLSNHIVCPTGVRFSADLVEKIKSNGGTVTDTLSSKVTILVAKDPNSTSSKIVKAREKGVKIIGLGDFEKEFATKVEIE